MKILVAVDRSKHSAETIDALHTFPFPPDSELILVHVCLVPDLHPLGHEVSRDVNQLVDEYRQEAETLLNEAAGKLQDRSWKVKTRLLTGHPAEAIISAAEREQADVIVIAGRGLSGLQRFLIGSISEKVATYAPCSVLVVRASADGRPPSANRILIADDGSDAATKIVASMSRLPLAPECRIRVLGVQETVPHWNIDKAIEADPHWHLHARQIEEHLRRSVTTLSAATPHVDFEYRKGEHAADEILNVAEDFSADLVVLGSTGKSVWERMLLGSVATRALRHAHCSVWIQRSRKT